MRSRFSACFGIVCTLSSLATFGSWTASSAIRRSCSVATSASRSNDEHCQVDLSFIIVVLCPLESALRPSFDSAPEKLADFDSIVASAASACMESASEQSCFPGSAMHLRSETAAVEGLGPTPPAN